jgi:hypothetical protein
MTLIVRLWNILYATATIVKNIESRLVDSDLPYIITLTSTIQLWLILYILMAYHFCILLMKEHDFKLVNGCKTLAPSIHGIYYKYTKSTYTWDPLILSYIIQARTL